MLPGGLLAALLVGGFAIESFGILDYYEGR